MNINELKNNLLEQVKGFEVSEFAFSDVLRNINEKVVNKAIKKANTFNIEKHCLYNRNSSNTELFNKVYSETMSFKDKEEYIKELFLKYTKEDKINEVLPYIDQENFFNVDKVKYFSLYDFTKNKTNEEITEFIKTKMLKLKEIRFNGCGLLDKYSKTNIINKLFEFFNYGFNYKLDLDFNTLYDMSLKDIEKYINQSGDIKIRIFKEFYYLSFKDNDKMQELKNRIEKNLIERVTRIKNY